MPLAKSHTFLPEFEKELRTKVGKQASRLFIQENDLPTAKMAVPLYGQDQRALGAYLRRAKRARRVRLRRKQPNPSNLSTWQLAAMNIAIRGLSRPSAASGQGRESGVERRQCADTVAAH